MNTAATFEIAPRFWSEEPSKRSGRRRIRAHIGGLHCSLCTGTIEKALGRRPGVDKVAVSFTHEQVRVTVVGEEIFLRQVIRSGELNRSVAEKWPQNFAR